MSGAIYNYTSHTLPTGGKDALAKLRTFLISHGWVSEHYETSVDWGSDGGTGYQWNAGNDDFCQMYSNGYGHQPIRMRFYVEYDATDTNHLKFYNTMVYPTNNGDLDYTSATVPYLKDYMYCSYMIYLSVPSGTFNSLHLFGNNKWCLCGFRCTATTFIQFNFGTPELYPEYRNTTELQMRYPGQQHNNVLYKWYALDAGSYQGYFYRPWGYRGSYSPQILWYDGAGKNYTGACCNYNTMAGSEVGHWNSFRNVRRVNSWSGRRLMIRPDFFVKNSSGVWEPIGHHPCHAVPVTGLAMGEVLKYGSEEYTTFPVPTYGQDDSFAIRTA